jgi:hypothetical protein
MCVYIYMYVYWGLSSSMSWKSRSQPGLNGMTFRVLNAAQSCSIIQGGIMQIVM